MEFTGVIGFLARLLGNAQYSIKSLQSFIYFFKSVAPNFFEFDVPHNNDYYAYCYSK
jgi:hypothetical protein